jgi:hypothetical protein
MATSAIPSVPGAAPSVMIFDLSTRSVRCLCRPYLKTPVRAAGPPTPKDQR